MQSWHSVRGIRGEPLTPHDLRKRMANFEATGLLSVPPGREKNLASVETEEIVELAGQETKNGNDTGCRTANERTLDYDA